MKVIHQFKNVIYLLVFVLMVLLINFESSVAQESTDNIYVSELDGFIREFYYFAS